MMMLSKTSATGKLALTFVRIDTEPPGGWQKNHGKDSPGTRVFLASSRVTGFFGAYHLPTLFKPTCLKACRLPVESLPASTIPHFALAVCRT